MAELVPTPAIVGKTVASVIETDYFCRITFTDGTEYTIEMSDRTTSPEENVFTYQTEEVNNDGKDN